MREIRDIILSRADEFWGEDQEASYSTSAVFQDVLVCLETTRDEIYALADEYRPIEMAKLDRAERPFEKIMERVEDDLASYDPHEDSPAKLETIVNTYNKAVNTLLNIMQRRARLIPIEMPKEMNVNKTVFTMSVEDWQEQAARELESGEIVEGEFTSSDE